MSPTITRSLDQLAAAGLLHKWSLTQMEIADPDRLNKNGSAILDELRLVEVALRVLIQGLTDTVSTDAEVADAMRQITEAWNTADGDLRALILGFYTKLAADERFATKAELLAKINADMVYTRQAMDALLLGKAEREHRHNAADIEGLPSGGGVPAGLFYKADSNSVVFTKTASGAISVKAGTKAEVAGIIVSFSSATAVVMPTMTGGTDYAVYVCNDSTVRADSSFTAPAGYTVAQVRQIGGFHYGLTPAGATIASGSFAAADWTQAKVDLIAGINAYSMWDLKWRPNCESPKGMVLVAGRYWADIYLLNTDHINLGTSAYAASSLNVASAYNSTKAPKKPLEFGGDGSASITNPTWWDFARIMASHGKSLLSHQDYISVVGGCTDSLKGNGGTDANVYSVQHVTGRVSYWGTEQTIGLDKIWGSDINAANSFVLLGDDYTANAGVYFPGGAFSNGGVLSPTTAGRGRADHLRSV